MGLFSKDIKTMDDLFVHTLRVIYYAEKQIVQSLPEMINKASDPQLKQGFQAHLGETKNHVTRLEQVFKMHHKEPRAVDCPAIDGIIDEAEEVAGEVEDKSVLDAALIASGRALRDHALRHVDRLGARAQRCGGVAAAEPRRGKGGRQEADRYGRKQSKPSRRVDLPAWRAGPSRGGVGRDRRHRSRKDSLLPGPHITRVLPRG